MVSYDLKYRVETLQKEISQLRIEISCLKSGSNDEMWDNSEMIRRWNVSKRTLASWRAEGKIDYVQVEGKIWYTKENREDFIRRNSVKNGYLV